MAGRSTRKAPPPFESGLDWLTAVLARLNVTGKDADTVARHAQEIHALVLAIRGSVNHTGFKIKGRTRLRAERVVADRGMANDLKHLLSAAESGSKRRWHTAWPKVSGQARDLVVGWKPSRPPVVERNKRDSEGPADHLQACGTRPRRAQQHQRAWPVHVVSAGCRGAAFDSRGYPQA